VRTPLGILDLPLSHEDRLRLPSVPSFAVDGLSVRSVSLDAVTVGVRLRVRNPNGFALPAGRLAYDLAVGGASVARAEGADLGAVAGGSTSVVELPVRISTLGASRAATDLVRGGDVDVGLSGTAQLAGIPLPLALKGRVPARR
jgi:LEA14-like dessication related protein